MPQSPKSNIDTYGLTHLKTKLMGDVEKDLTRLERIADLVSGHVTKDDGLALAGTGNTRRSRLFRACGRRYRPTLSWHRSLKHLLLVKQPFRRQRGPVVGVGDPRNHSQGRIVWRTGNELKWTLCFSTWEA